MKNESSSLTKLLHAENIAKKLFQRIEQEKIIQPGKFESQINEEIYSLAKSSFNIEKYWHKRIVRAGKNTLLPYDENPQDLMIQENDVVFLDFGPILEEWEADFGRTYVVGENPKHHKICKDVEIIWNEVSNWVINQSKVSCAQIFEFACEKSREFGWEFGGEIAGHLIGQFPHERIEKGSVGLYIHPNNPLIWPSKNKLGENRTWILEIHIVEKVDGFGAFYEQILR